ncbi:MULTISPECIES: DUF1735 domain-containing protein [unclassified Mucilaginibacter]|uniref:DUF1735 domain-containing protein n=1 Tax=unclassified Mucilaginibacter TaxID=2617802 RepID=UPI002AC8B0E4|nr:MULTISPECIES: DUF1735 domain-containing protein [unclassified Mucilaginibacter]MEB0263796.1 DUF1735 domain-containing protein [Mucilaginibacter sp. 10I4]MEB0278254.1 DUF1735 domain-containing protein [Mucilaginibacter sp. 10B2]MEB0300960.1 DUF1735 domain-containing protein [Mucilaginibacter sp. 5C4]WPX23900.1 DUF1735 domain-containing protein [Mucilaginibacter sp. 5C4]
MKIRNYIKTALLSVMAISLLSSCLKDDSRTVDFSKGGQSAEIPLSGLSSGNFSAAAITSDTAELAFGVNIASSSTLSHDQSITVDVIPGLIAPYNAANPSIAYELMPASAYTFKTTVVNIPAGQRYKIVNFIVYKNLLDPSKSYMLPIGITKADGLTISANQSVNYYHVIGNDFAGAYFGTFTRTPAGGDYTAKAVKLNPVSPTSFQAPSGYAALGVHYDVSFSQTGTGASATYSNFKVVLNANDVKNLFTANGITVTTPASFVNAPVAGKQYAYVEALSLFNFQYDVTNSVGRARHVQDRFFK